MRTPDQRQSGAWFALAVLFAINTMNFYDRQIVGVLTEPILTEFQLNDKQLGLLNTVFTLIYATVGVPLGRLSDRSSRTRILSIGVAVWSLLTAATGAAWNYASMFCLRIGVGVGEATCAPAANSLVGDLFPARQRARALSVMMLGLPAAIFLSTLLSGAIAHQYGWRSAFYVACVPGLLLGVLILFVREPLRGQFDQLSDRPNLASHRPGSPYRLVLGTPTMLWIIASGALHNYNAYALMGFLQSYIQRYHGLALKDAAIVNSIVIGAVGIPGLIIGGWLCDRVQRSRPNGRLLVCAFAVLLSAPCLYLGLEQSSGEIGPFMVFMGAGMMLIYVYYAGVYAAIQDVIEPGLRATAMALYFFAMYPFGGSFGSFVTGALSDRFSRAAMIAAGGAPNEVTVPLQFKAIGLHQALYVTPVVCVALSAVLFAAARTVRGDMQKLQEWYQQSARDASSVD